MYVIYPCSCYDSNDESNIQNEYDLEIFMEYLDIPKKSDYNSEKRRLNVIEQKERKHDEVETDDDEYGFDIEKLTKEQTAISIVEGNETVAYDLVIDEQIVSYYISYLFINDFKSCMDNIQLRFKSQWLTQWIQTV